MNEYYRTVITVEVLSDRPILDDSLQSIAENMSTGDLSGQIIDMDQQSVDAGTMAILLQEQNSDPEFLLGDNWNSSYDPREEALTKSELNEGKADY